MKHLLSATLLATGLLLPLAATAGLFGTSYKDVIAPLGPIEQPLVSCVERLGHRRAPSQFRDCLEHFLPKSQPGLRKCMLDALDSAGRSPVKESVTRGCLSSHIDETTPESCFALEGFAQRETPHDVDDIPNGEPGGPWTADTVLREICFDHHKAKMDLEACFGMAKTLRGTVVLGWHDRPELEDEFTRRCIWAKHETMSIAQCMNHSSRIWSSAARAQLEDGCVALAINDLELETDRFKAGLDKLRAGLKEVESGVKYVIERKELAELYRSIYGQRPTP